MTLIKTVYEIAKLAIAFSKKAQKFSSGESTFIRRFPPHLRKDVGTIIKGASTVTYGGLVSDILKDYMMADDSPGNGPAKPISPKSQTTSSPSYKARHRRTRRCRPRNERRY